MCVSRASSNNGCCNNKCTDVVCGSLMAISHNHHTLVVQNERIAKTLTCVVCSALTTDIITCARCHSVVCQSSKCAGRPHATCPLCGCSEFEPPGLMLRLTFEALHVRCPMHDKCVLQLKDVDAHLQVEEEKNISSASVVQRVKSLPTLRRQNSNEPVHTRRLYLFLSTHALLLCAADVA
eukprot:PhM_4_TR14110/c1_g4_i4/m.43021